MIKVIEVKTKKQQREFLNFPLVLYKDNPNFCPPLYGDEKKIFKAGYVYYDQSEAVYYNAYRDGVMAGRISGILQKAHNESSFISFAWLVFFRFFLKSRPFFLLMPRLL